MATTGKLVIQQQEKSMGTKIDKENKFSIEKKKNIIDHRDSPKAVLAYPE